MSSGRGGGAATALGVDYQSRIVAWALCQILAGPLAISRWDWPQNSTWSRVTSEAKSVVDDIVVENSYGDRAFLQAKHRVQLSSSPSGPLGSALDQFVGQLEEAKDGDRFILATSSETSARLRAEVPRILERARRLPPESSIWDAASGQSETEALEILVGHIRRAWGERRGAVPSEADIKDLMARTYLSVIDVLDAQTDHQAALFLLRSSVLGRPEDDVVTWRQLVAIANEMSHLQATATSQWIAGSLVKSGISLLAQASLRPDIATLRSYSQSTVRRLSNFARLNGAANAGNQIERDFQKALNASARNGSLLVVGEPGAGKSAALYALARELGKTHDVVVLAADVVSTDEADSLRQEIGLNHDLGAILRGWPGTEPGYLVIDAMDAARGAETQRMLLDLIEQTASDDGRWRVIASVRQFDLRYNPRLQDAFPRRDGPLQHATPEFSRIAHFYIPELSDLELNQFCDNSAPLRAAVDSASRALQELVHNPFCLRLLSELVHHGVTSGDLTPVQDRIDLLDLYWVHRVLLANADEHEHALRVACERMLATRRLNVSRMELLSGNVAPSALSDLLKLHVLSERVDNGVLRRESLSFAHHILFDYAVARLIFREPRDAVIERTEVRPELALFARPSIAMHFSHLWRISSDRREFWDLAIRWSGHSATPEIAKIIAPGIAAVEIATIDDVQVPLAAIRAKGHSAVVYVLQHMIGARLADGDLGDAVPMSKRHVWGVIAEHLATPADADTAPLVRALLMELCRKPEVVEVDEIDPLGRSARSLLTWARETGRKDRFLLSVAIESVARTFSSDADESERLLRQVLEGTRLTDNGHVEAPIISDEVRLLAAHSPELVRDIYVALFGYSEKSSEQTVMHRGVLGMTSNRRQDYESSHYNLGQFFPEFLNVAPTLAIEALIGVRIAFAPYGDGDDGTFEIESDEGESIIIVRDRSYWESDVPSHDTEDEMLVQFGAWLGDLAPGNGLQFESVVEIACGRPTPSAIWRTILRRANGRVAEKLASVVASREALTSIELSDVIGDYIARNYQDLSESLRERIERQIMSLTKERGADDATGRIRDRLLGCIPIDLILYPPAAERLRHLIESDTVPENRSAARMFSYDSEYTEADRLADLGVDITIAPNAYVKELEAEVRSFAEQFQSEPPDEAHILGVAPYLGPLYDYLLVPHADVSDTLLDQSWEHLAAAAAAVTRVDCKAFLNNDTFEAIRKVLLSASEHRLPEPLTNLESFDRSPSWSSIAPRIEAVQGLLNLSYFGNADDRELSALARLAIDQNPAVRLQVADRVMFLREHANGAMWKMLDAMLESEVSTVVLSRVVSRLRSLLVDAPSELLIRADRLFNRSFDLAGGHRVRDYVVALKTDLYIWNGNDAAEASVREMLRDATAEPREVKEVGRRLREPFGVARRRDDDAVIRDRAFEVGLLLLNSARDAYDFYAARIEAGFADQPLTEDLERFKAAARILNGIASDVYFASGAYDRNDEERQVPDAGAFFISARALLAELQRVPIAGATHYVLQTLQYLIPQSPREVFIIIAAVIRGGRADGYQWDPMGATLVVSILKRYFAEYQSLLQEDAECRSILIEVLDIFVGVGWPEARRLTYGLHELFR